jgi:hypothetical protein
VKRALVTFATGDQTELLELALPGFEAYADRHGYDLLTDPPRLNVRPPSWGKVIRLLQTLGRYQEVLWVDADVLILRDDVDVADEVDPDAWQAITLHETREGSIPSCGVWYCRPELRPALEEMWRMSRYTNHPWWEQAALHDALGYGGTPVRLLAPTDLYDRTCWLDPGWNSLRLEYPEGPEDDEPRFVHVGPGSRVAWRAGQMRELIAREFAREGV